MELMIIFLILLFVWYLINKRSDKLTITEKVIMDSFSLDVNVAKLIGRLLNDNVLGEYLLDTVSERCLNDLTYQGPICLDGSPDCRYNLSRYGYKLDQTLINVLSFVSMDGCSNIEREILSGKNTLSVSTYSKGKESKFLGQADLKLTCLWKIKEFNLFSFCLMNKELRELIFILVGLEEENNKINALREDVNFKIKDLTNRIKLLEQYGKKLTPEECKSYEGLKVDLENISGKLKAVDKKDKDNAKVIAVISSDISVWVSKNISKIKEDFENYKLRKEIQNIISQ
ncbi:hypothetical protein [Vibrio vulnificus]|uniref:hypothetical protein n=1 Tax=Vibrio vulnificus TaxID=672 RepID=UPI004058F4CB